MAKVVLIWEMGADLGHVFGLRSLAVELCQQGHDVTMVLCDTSTFEPVAGKQNTTFPFSIIKAPSPPATKKIKLTRPPANLTELLLVNGYNDADYLATQLLLWRNLIGALNPDVIVYDFAPTALLASRDMACKKITLGSPFTMPPLLHPLPSFNLDGKVSDNNLRISENKFIQMVNKALALISLEPIHFACEVFAADDQFVASIPELDPYRQWRKLPQYVGAITSNVVMGKSLDWQTASSQKKIFVYLKPTYTPLEFLLEVLDQLGVEAKVFVPNIPKHIIDKFTHSQLTISPTPFLLGEDLSACDLVICHGGNGTLTSSVLHGAPCLIIPQQQEQLSNAHQCIAAGLGLGLGPHVIDKEKISSLLNRLLTAPEFKQAASACQRKYHYLTQQHVLNTLIHAIESSL